MTYFVQELKRIVGNEDGTGGEDGTITVEGFLARCIVTEIGMSSQSVLYGVVFDSPVRVSRQGKLDLWINGWYAEGSGVRRIVHNAIRRYEQDLPAHRATGFVHH